MTLLEYMRSVKVKLGVMLMYLKIGKLALMGIECRMALRQSLMRLLLKSLSSFVLMLLVRVPE